MGMNHIAPNYLSFVGKDAAAAARLAQVERDFRAWHFNTLGMHCAGDFVAPLRKDFFFVVPLSPVRFTGGSAYASIRYGDPFTPAFAEEISRLAQARCPALVGERRLLGYAFCDIPPWIVPDHILKQTPTLGVTHPWVRKLRSLPTESPGKRAWQRVLRAHYSTLEKAATVYPGLPSDWEAWAAVTDWPEATDAAAGRADSDALMAEIAERYYACHTRAIRAVDPAAIIFGDKLNGYRIPEYLYPVLRRHVDVVMVQINGFIGKQQPALESIHRRTGKPIVSGDFAFNIADHPHQTNGIGTKLPSWPEVGAAYHDYLKGLMSLPYMIGWHYCGYIETWDGATTAPMQQSGFRQPDGTERTEVTAPMQQANGQAEIWHRVAKALTPP